MDITLHQIVFFAVALFISVFSVLTVTTGRILRAATYLLFVLFGTAAIYFSLGYTFLGAVQLMIYAGGIVVLYVFSILLTNSDKSINLKIKRTRFWAVLVTVLAGAALVSFITFTHTFTHSLVPSGRELGMKVIGNTLMGTGKYQYILPFEVISVLLLACIIGGILIARKR
ncbi:NADH-quinone oxidoreductase subunit J family protein [Parabacteroides pacaensis]|uniref:NADH-quinone oxidoreductase subunit J family protein n=1 Tax=Parabacteroides pacaensis TaxID=2086575 RepID=UPI000D0EE08A|nr:NADH-quinone oxidoreductase subunit J [Parabacteroides pacaensis]